MDGSTGSTEQIFSTIPEFKLQYPKTIPNANRNFVIMVVSKHDFQPTNVGVRSLRPPRRRQQDMRTTTTTMNDTNNNDQGSIIWTILLIGVIFCLADVAYILSYIDSSSSSLALASLLSQEQQVKEQEQQQYNTKKTKKNQHLHVDTTLLKKGKERILAIIQDAGISFIDNETLQELPTWQEIVDLYGPEPLIYGLDQCKDFQTHSPSYDHFCSTAGTFNSGTNLMAELLIANCQMKDRMIKYGYKNKGIRWQVPWGKHTPPGDEHFRNTHKTVKDRNVSVADILPAVTIRDPYSWMESMCRINYGAHWYMDRERHCPNLLPDEQDLMKFHGKLKENKPVDVHVKYSDFWRHHKSLAHFWNDYYREYMNVSFSRLIVRYEDLLFHTKEVTQQVCTCAGGEMSPFSFKYIVGTAKRGVTAHGSDRTGFVEALIKYGKADKRAAKFTDRDLEFARENLDPEMMQLFGYKHPPKRDDY